MPIFFSNPRFVASFISGVAAFVLTYGKFASALPYHVITENELPAVSMAAAAGNPLKGFLTSPLWVDPTNQLVDIPSSLDYYYIPLKTTMTNYNTFDWSHLEGLLQGSASRSRHAVLRFILDYPSQETHVPQFLIDGGLQFDTYTSHGGGMSPDYDDPNLLTALEQFIAAFGFNYDGDQRIAFIQLGLIGYWGEWHTFPETSFLPNDHPTRNSVAVWYSNSFSVTPIQVRTPADAKLSGVNIGLHDDSFAFSTLGSLGWHFWPKVQAESYTDFWQTQVMGGEIYPGSQSSCFSSTFGIPTSDTEQAVDYCISTTHATYLLLNYAFAPWLGYSGDDISRAIEASDLLGYAFAVTRVEASESLTVGVDVSVDVTQEGVAPFYYPLALQLDCDGASMSVDGVQAIISQGDKSTFVFSSVPATTSCLNSVTLSLFSSHAYAGNPVKLVQSSGTVEFSLPPPPSISSMSPSNAPSGLPTMVPTIISSTSPSGAPTEDTTSTPSISPSPIPSAEPSEFPSQVVFDTDVPTSSPIETCFWGGEGLPCTFSTNCCSGVGNCSGGKRDSRTCLGSSSPTDPTAAPVTSPPSTTSAPVKTPTGGCGTNKAPCFNNSDCCSQNCKSNQCKGG